MNGTERKKAIQRGSQSNKKEKSVIFLDPKKLEYPRRMKAAKLAIVKKVAKTGNLEKLGKLEDFNEDEIITPEYTAFDDTCIYLAGMKEGAIMHEKHDRVKQNSRTEKATQQKRAMREKKATVVEDAYIQLDKRSDLKNLSEHKMAQRVYEYVLPLLKSQKVRGVPVLKQKIDGKITGISLTLIKDILQKSTRIKHYPWRGNASTT